MLKKHFIELAMAVLMLVCFYILSWEAAETAGRLIDVSGNIKADQVILVDAGHGGVDSGMVGIGGLKEKLLAAVRAGIKKVLIPEENVKDLEEVPDNVKQAVEIVPVRWIDKVLEEALVSKPSPLEPKKEKEVAADVVAQSQEVDSGEATTAGGHCNC